MNLDDWSFVWDKQVLEEQRFKTITENVLKMLQYRKVGDIKQAPDAVQQGYDEIFTSFYPTQTSERKMHICFIRDKKMGVNIVRSCIQAAQNIHGITHVILIADQIIRQAIEYAQSVVGCKVELLPLDLFDTDLLSTSLCKRSIPTLMNDEEFYKMYKINPEDKLRLAKIEEVDRVAMYLGAQPGQVISFLRFSETNGYYYFPKLVVAGKRLPSS